MHEVYLYSYMANTISQLTQCVGIAQIPTDK